MVLALLDNVKRVFRPMLHLWRTSWNVRWLVAVIVAAIVTPPDPFSMIIVWIPLLVLGEIVALVLRHSRSAAEHEKARSAGADRTQ